MEDKNNAQIWRVIPSQATLYHTSRNGTTPPQSCQTVVSNLQTLTDHTAKDSFPEEPIT